MTQPQLRRRVALIVVVGHVIVFAFGLLVLGLFGPLFASDALQTILMATPILGVISLAALKWLMTPANQNASGATELVEKTLAFVVTFIPCSLIVCILVVFLAAFFQLRGLGPDQVKIYIGFIETFFGIYVGAVSDHLFNSEKTKSARSLRRSIQ